MVTYDKAYELVRELRESDEYKEYLKARAEVESNESALAILRDYRRRQLEVQSGALAGKEPPESSVAELKRLQDLIEMHGPVRRFIQAEERMMVIVADVQKIIADGLDLLRY